MEIGVGVDYLVKEKKRKSLKWAIVSRHDVPGADGVAGFDDTSEHHG